MDNTSFESLSGAQRAALVVLSLDESAATDVLRHLNPSEVKKLAQVVESLNPVPYDALVPTLEAFVARFGEPVLPTTGSVYMRQLAAHAFGEERARLLLAQPTSPAKSALDTIATARVNTLAELLAEEHPQLAAVVLSQLPREQATKTLLLMREDRQVDLLVRIAGLAEIPKRALVDASSSLLSALRDAGGLADDDDSAQFDGISFTAALMNELPTDDNERLMEELEDSLPELAPRIREAMFTFEDLGRLDPRSIQGLMREISSDQLLIALRTAAESLREKFLSAVSKRAAETMREDLELMPPKRLSEVEEAQRGIVEAAMRLASDGQITMPGGSGDEMV